MTDGHGHCTLAWLGHLCVSEAPSWSTVTICATASMRRCERLTGSVGLSLSLLTRAGHCARSLACSRPLAPTTVASSDPACPQWRKPHTRYGLRDASGLRLLPSFIQLGRRWQVNLLESLPCLHDAAQARLASPALRPLARSDPRRRVQSTHAVAIVGTLARRHSIALTPRADAWVLLAAIS